MQVKKKKKKSLWLHNFNRKRGFSVHLNICVTSPQIFQMNNSTFIFFFFLQVNTSLRKDPCGKSTHDSHLWFTIINAEPLIQHPLSPCRIYSSLYITDKVSYDAIKWPLDFNQTHVVWRIWSLNKARKTITQLRCKTKQRLKWTPKETFLWDYAKLQTAPCFHTTGTIE